jgi:hypothetical protein
MDVKEMTRRLDEIVVNGTPNEIQLNTRKDPQWKVLQAVAAKPAA